MDSEEAALSAADGGAEFEWLGWGAFSVQTTPPTMTTPPDQRFRWL